MNNSVKRLQNLETTTNRQSFCYTRFGYCMEKSELNSTVILYEILVCYNCNASDLVSISISIVPTTLELDGTGVVEFEHSFKSHSFLNFPFDLKTNKNSSNQSSGLFKHHKLRLWSPALSTLTENN